MKKDFKIYLPATKLAPAIFAKTIEIEVIVHNNEEFLTMGSSTLIDEEHEKALFEHALKLAEELHEGQFRRDGVTPYFKHIKDVVSRVHTWERKTLAALHDVLEDDRVTKNGLLKRNIPNRIITKLDVLDKKSEDYFNYIDDIKFASEDIKAVKIADIISNLSDSLSEKQVKKYAKALDILLCSNIYP